MRPAKGVLVLETHEQFEGDLFGADLPDYSTGSDQGFGEVVFNTSMQGYQEIVTDPSYYGEIICFTTAHVGNTGINLDDNESKKIWCAGVVLQELTDIPSNWRSKKSFESFLKEHGIPGIKNVDTRALTRVLRIQGVSRGVILPWEQRSKGNELLARLPKFESRDMIREVTTKSPYFWKSGRGHYVVAIDYGVKHGLLNHLSDRGCRVEVVPATISAREILERNPDGVFLSNGPGDPSAAPYAVTCVRTLLGRIPIFGVCMGHQILGLALGGKTFKLKFGHRGGNQPVFCHESGKVEISSHNHGYAVDSTSLPSDAVVTHLNLNDKTVEGLKAPKMNAFSVQYHPEACPGPHDSQHLFDDFINSMKARA